MCSVYVLIKEIFQSLTARDDTGDGEANGRKCTNERSEKVNISLFLVPFFLIFLFLFWGGLK